MIQNKVLEVKSLGQIVGSQHLAELCEDHEHFNPQENFPEKNKFEPCAWETSLAGKKKLSSA